MGNFFKDNPDLVFTLENTDLGPIAELVEDGYKYAQEFDNAPENFEDALDNYREALKVIGEIASDRIEPRSRPVDAEGPKFENGKVTYHPLTTQNLKDLADAGLIVIRQDFATRDQILDGVQQLADCRLPIIGCVINDTRGSGWEKYSLHVCIFYSVHNLYCSNND